MPECVSNKGPVWYHTSFKGPWQVCNIRNTAHKYGWYIVNTKSGRTKYIGRVTGRGYNYHDEACRLAIQRNAGLGFYADIDEYNNLMNNYRG